MESAYDRATKMQLFKFLPEVHNTQHVRELGATVLPFVWSLFGAAGRGPTPRR